MHLTILNEQPRMHGMHGAGGKRGSGVTPSGVTPWGAKQPLGTAMQISPVSDSSQSGSASRLRAAEP